GYILPRHFDHARDIAAEYLPLGDSAHLHGAAVRGIHRRGMDPDQHLIVARDGLLRLAVHQRVRALAFVIHYGLHVCLSFRASPYARGACYTIGATRAVCHDQSAVTSRLNTSL